MNRVTLAHANEAIRRRARLKAVEIVFWIAAAASYFMFPARLVLLTQILITGLFAMALDVLLGYGGIASLGHAAFFGVGAYTAGLLASHHWGEPISGLIAAGAMAGALGLLVSTVIVGVHGVAVFVVTMCVGLLIYEIANRIPWITGGDTGLQGFVMQPLLGRFEFDLFGKTGFWYTYAVSLTMYLSVRRYISSPEGLALEGMRENASRIAAIGISASRRKLMAFTTSAVIAGIAGALLAQITQVVALETLSFDRSVSTLIILIVGGTRDAARRFCRRRGFRIGARHTVLARPNLLDVLARLDLDWHGSGGAGRNCWRADETERAYLESIVVTKIALETIGLSRRFGGLSVINSANIKVRSGGRQALIGPNGAGKSTLINLLTGVLTPSAGSIVLDGERIDGLSVEQRVARGLGRTYQINTLFPHLTRSVADSGNCTARRFTVKAVGCFGSLLGRR